MQIQVWGKGGFIVFFLYLLLENLTGMLEVILAFRKGIMQH